MRSGWAHRELWTLAVGLLALMLAATLLPQTALAGYQMTRAQNDEITKVTSTLGEVLVRGGRSPEDAQQAVIAVRAGLIAAYSKGLSNEEAAKAVGPIVDPFLRQPGANQRPLTAIELDEIEKTKNNTREYIGAIVPEREASALARSAELAMTNHRMSRASADDLSLTGLVLEAASVLHPFDDLPARVRPESPFHNGMPTFSETAESAPPPPSASAAPPPGPPVDASGNPIDVNDPDAITVIGDDGKVVQDRPDGDGGREIVESQVGDQNYGNGNSKEKEKDEKKDKDSGGKNESNNGGKNDSGGGSGHHK